MEGANIGYNHNNTEFWGFFGAEFLYMGLIDDVYQVYGEEGTYSEDLALYYAGGSNAHYRLDEIGENGGTLFLEDEDEKGRGVYNIARGYRTICTSPVIGAYGLGEGLSFNAFLMGQYIDFLRGSLVDLDDIIVPSQVAYLGYNYPNPFNPSGTGRSPETKIEFYLPIENKVSLEVFNLKGEIVNILLDDYRPAGIHNVIWDGKDNNGRAVNSGIYFYRMKSGSYTSSRKMILVK